MLNEKRNFILKKDFHLSLATCHLSLVTTRLRFGQRLPLKCSHIILHWNKNHQTTTFQQAQGKNYQITKSSAVIHVLLRNKKSAPIRLRSGQALAK